MAIGGLRITDEAALPRASAPLPTTLLAGMRILVFDDDADVLASTRSVLEKWGCIVEARGGPADAVAPCDLILADHDLNAAMTGADCIEAARRALGREVPAILMTAHDEARVRSGVSDPDLPILTKPVRPAELRATLLSLRLGSADQ